MGNSSKLIWDANDYESSNAGQQRDAAQLMEQILKDGVNDVEIIVDIGCGSGNVTQELSKRIPHRKIYASDFDPQMVKYAEKNHKDETIEYFVQDIGLPWEKLDDRLKALEGKVDLVWSNRVLHWVPDKATAAKTIARLLKPGGRCYVNVSLLRDPFAFDEENKKKYEKLYSLGPIEKQIEMFKSYFENSGLSQVNIEMLKKDWTYESEKQYQQMFSSSADFWNLLIHPPADYPEEERKNLIQKMNKVGILSYSFPYGTDPNNNEPKDKLKVYYEQGRIIGVK